MQTGASKHDNYEDSGTMNFTALRNTLSKGGEHLGDVVWWMLNGADIPRDELLATWLSHGLDKDLLPQEPTPEKAIRLAVHEAMLGKDRKKVAIQPTLDSEKSMIYAVGSWMTNASGDHTKFEQEGLVLLDRSVTPNTVTTDNSDNELAAKVIEAYPRFLTNHISRDVMASITKALKSWDSVMLRETGGIYFVPRTQSDNLRALQGAIEELGESLVFLLPVHKTEDAVRSLGTAATGSLESDLTELREEIDEFLANPSGTHTKTLKTRLDAFEELRGRARLYTSILGVTVGDLTEQLKAMETSVQGMIATKEIAAK